MFKKIKLFIFLVLLSACTDSSTTKISEISAITTVVEIKPKATNEIRKECFRNEFPYNDGSANKDIEELNVIIENQKVTGVYNYLPSEKDQRIGTFEGVLEGNKINATYKYEQEGMEGTASITITLASGKAIIKNIAESEPYFLDATLSKIECQE